MSLKDRKAKLKQRQRKECRAINDRYRNLVRQLEAKCAEHEFDEWQTRWNGLDNFWCTNFRGDVMYFSECRVCGKSKSRVGDA